MTPVLSFVGWAWAHRIDVGPVAVQQDLNMTVVPYAGDSYHRKNCDMSETCL